MGTFIHWFRERPEMYPGLHLGLGSGRAYGTQCQMPNLRRASLACHGRGRPGPRERSTTHTNSDHASRLARPDQCEATGPTRTRPTRNRPTRNRPTRTRPTRNRPTRNPERGSPGPRERPRDHRVYGSVLAISGALSFGFRCAASRWCRVRCSFRSSKPSSGVST